MKAAKRDAKIVAAKVRRPKLATEAKSAAFSLVGFFRGWLGTPDTVPSQTRAERKSANRSMARRMRRRILGKRRHEAACDRRYYEMRLGADRSPDPKHLHPRHLRRRQPA